MLKLLLFVTVSAKFMALTLADASDVSDAAQCYFNNLATAINEGMVSNNDITDANERFYAACKDLTGICMYNLVQTHGNENQMTSIFPMMFALAQLATFTEKNDITTYNECIKILNLYNIDEICENIPTRVADFNNHSPNNYTSTLESSMIVNNKYKFTEEATKTYNTLFQGKINYLDYSNSSGSINYINNWVKQYDCYQYDDLLSQKQEPNGLIFLNFNHVTVYWGSSFRPSKRVPINFFGTDDIVTPTIGWYGEGFAKYGENKDLNSKVVDLTLSGDFKMVIVYPNEGVELGNVLYKLVNSTVFSKACSETKLTYLKLSLPMDGDVYGQEDFTSGLKLLLQLSETFNSGYNGFRDGFEDCVGPHLGHMFHTMHLTYTDGEDIDDISESQIEDSECDVTTLNVTRPFIYYVVWEPFLIPIMSGIVNKPKISDE